MELTFLWVKTDSKQVKYIGWQMVMNSTEENNPGNGEREYLGVGLALLFEIK